MHLNALRKIVRMRGGINGMAMQKSLHMLISWYASRVADKNNLNATRQDYVCSSLRAARFTQIHYNAFTHAPAFFFRQKSMGRNVEEKATRAPVPLDLQGIMLPIFRDLHTLADMVSDFRTPATTCSPRYMAFTQMRVSLDHRAFDFSIGPEHQGKRYSSTLIACCMATLAFTHLTLRDFQPTCKGSLAFTPCSA